jgi:RNA polymerase sigma-70 factor (ECF subfamily)
VSSEAAAYLSNAVPQVSEIDRSPYVTLSATRSTDTSSDQITAIDTLAKEQSDEILILNISNGSREALSILFQRRARTVFNVASRILKDNSEAEDLVQDLFLFLFHKASQFDPTKGSAASWIIQMTYHRAIDRRRYLTTRNHYNAQEFNEDRHQATRGQISISDVAARVLLHKLRAELSPEQRETLELHFFEGYTFHEIAERTGQALGNVRHHYYRGLERLRSHVFSGKTPQK